MSRFGCQLESGAISLGCAFVLVVHVEPFTEASERLGLGMSVDFRLHSGWGRALGSGEWGEPRKEQNQAPP
ncbi:hypothetical protein SBA2_260025 [Acidobacteriia bacterium SbA2]|nr:hypothetical protein SBA2_260025 [Acidobacteriia bacterium SbA2]